MKGRTIWYESVSEMQEDLDAYIETYNRNRPHRGRGMEGRPPYQGVHEGDPEAQDPEEVNQEGGEDRSLKALTSARPGVR